MSQLKPAAQRVQDELRAKGLDAEVRHMPASTRTAQEAADACGCQVGQIVKSLIFRGARSGQPYLLLVSGINRVDETVAADQIGEPLGRADAQFVREATGFAIGGIPPLGHAKPIATFIDEALLSHRGRLGRGRDARCGLSDRTGASCSSRCCPADPRYPGPGTC